MIITLLSHLETLFLTEFSHQTFLADKIMAKTLQHRGEVQEVSNQRARCPRISLQFLLFCGPPLPSFLSL